MKVILSFIFVLMGLASMGQSTLPLRADTVLVEKTGGSGELKIKNSTRDSLGLLVNIGGGRTRFMRVRQITDTSFIIPNGAGGDTIRIVSGGGGGGTGSVTQVNTGYGLDGGPITTTGTLLVDSAELANYFLRRKDSTLYATQSDLQELPIPTLQQVADAGNTTTTPVIADSVRSRSITADSSLYAAVRAASDTINTATRRGDIRFDSTTNSMMYRGNDFWTYFASLSNALIPNRPNMRLIAGVFRPSISGSVITWNWIINPTHDSVGFGSIGCNGTDVLLTLQNEAVKIHTIIAVPDEQLAGQIDLGISFQTTQALVRIYRRYGVKNTVLRGNGTTYVKTDGGGGSFTMSYSSGDLKLDWQSAYSTSAFGVMAQYVGSNGYHLERQSSGLSGYDARWLIKDAFGNTITANPTTTDAIDVIVPEWATVSINPCAAGGDGWAASVLNEFSNIWVFGLIEY